MAGSSSSQRIDLDAVLEISLDPVVVMHPDGTVAGWSKAAERCFGWTLAEVEGRRMSELVIPPQHRQAHEQGLARFLRTGEGPVIDQHIEITAINRDGKEFPVELSITHSDKFGAPLFIGFIRDISERHDAQRRQELLLRELKHRVKNMLAVVSGIAHQTARNSSTVDEFQSNFLGRLGALASAHELLAVEEKGQAPLDALMTLLVGPYADGSEPKISYSGPDVQLGSAQLVSLSMILHELLTNAIKYGALAVAAGQVTIDWQADEAGALLLAWRECGLENVVEPRRSGFGRRMIDLTASYELAGSTDWAWEQDGLVFTLRFAHHEAANGGQDGDD